jgi:hypothetical protein
VVDGVTLDLGGNDGDGGTVDVDVAALG